MSECGRTEAQTHAEFGLPLCLESWWTLTHILVWWDMNYRIVMNMLFLGAKQWKCKGTFWNRRSYYSSSFTFFPLKSMAAHRVACWKVMKFGTMVEDSLNSSKFGVFNSILQAPPTVQSFTHVYANKFW